MPTILIIEDDTDIRELARLVLTRAGHTVFAESNATTGIATAHRQIPDLILMDINLPHVDGWTATRIIKSDPALAHIPIVAWTALPIQAGEAGARAAGYDAYLPKPVETERFADQIQAVLEATTHKLPTRDELTTRAPSQLRILPPSHPSYSHADLEALYRASQVLSASLDPATVLTTILEQATLSTGAARSGLYVLDVDLRPAQQLHAGGGANLSKETLEAILESGAAGWAISHLEPVLIRDSSSDPRWVKIGEDTSPQSALLVPLVGRTGVLGVLALSHDQIGHFTQEHVELLSSFAAQAAIALDNARLYEQARSERQKLLAILDSSADAVIVTDIHGRITMANTVAGRLLNVHADAAGPSIREALAASPLSALYSLAEERDEPVSLEFEIQGVAYHASVRPVPGVGYIALLQDVHLLREIERMERERERQETERIWREFARHMSPQVVRLLVKRGETLVPRKCQAAVLFADLRNYTNLTERIGVEAMLEYVLKRFIAVVTDIVYANEGTVDKLLGDGILAVFGVPIPQDDAPQRALSTAMLIWRAMNMLHDGWLRDLGQDITAGMGLTWGEVIAGNIGSAQRVDYTVIGDPVNIAARLASIASAGEILVSQALAEAVGGDSQEWQLEALPPVLLKGKELPQQVYRAVPIWPAL
jgi:class 3 adenylate cyclase/CheY-like chemotaxis protein/GAF domain-containing protein